MNTFVDIAYKSIHKYGEELCGDHIEIIEQDNEVIAVMSDGLGSGVKANILATLTSKIAITMLKEGADIEETVETIIKTLPECSVRKLAYSTFTIIRIDRNYDVYIVEYDNPPILLYRDGVVFSAEKKEKKIHGKRIFETRFQMQKGDMISIISDGAVHAGVGALLNLGWQWDDINMYLLDLNRIKKTADNIVTNFMGICNNLYDDHPGDDTTILTLKIREKELVNLFTGPPKDRDWDAQVVDELQHAFGKKVICGGTSANIVARALDKKIEVEIESMTESVPPYAYMDGFDLVTEGVLTLQKALEWLRAYNELGEQLETRKLPSEDNGAALLARLLIADCTHLKMWVGRAINPAHQNPDLPIDLNIKLRIIKEMIKELQVMGKKVEVTFL